MIGSTRQVAVWAYGAAADLRKGFDGLSGLVSQGLERDPLSGDCYLFVNAWLLMSGGMGPRTRGDRRRRVRCCLRSRQDADGRGD